MMESALHGRMSRTAELLRKQSDRCRFTCFTSPRQTSASKRTSDCFATRMFSSNCARDWLRKIEELPLWRQTERDGKLHDQFRRGSESLVVVHRSNGLSRPGIGPI